MILRAGRALTVPTVPVTTTKVARYYSVKPKQLGWLLSRDLYQLVQEILLPEYQLKSFYDQSILEKSFDRNIFTSRHSQIGKILDDEALEYYEQRLSERTTCIHKFLAPEFTVTNKEAIAILCGSTDSKIPLSPVSKIKTIDNLKSIYLDSFKLKILGQSVFHKTRNIMVLFGDVQYLSTPWDDLARFLSKMNHHTIIHTFMKNHSMFKSLIPVKGAFRLNQTYSQNDASLTGLQRKQKHEFISQRIREYSAVNSFHLMLGILVVKYGQEHVIENFIVPKILEGRNGIISLIMEKINKRSYD